MDVSFEAALLVVGLLLVGAAAFSGKLRATVLSISVLSLGAGIALAATGLVEVSPSDKTVLYAVELALILTLFADGLVVERELLASHWTPTALALVVAMPVTLVLLALAARVLFPDLGWAEAFLLGAVLSPTDPVVTSSVVTSPKVPATVRHTLNLESGLNDGLALPFVLFFLVLATDAGSPGIEALKLGGEALAGAAVGIGVALVGARVFRSLPGGWVEHRYEGVFAFALAFVAFGLAETTGLANGLIAVFVAGIALAVVRHELPETFLDFNESISALFQVITFTLFGALIVATGWDGSTLALAAFIGFALFVARPLAVLLAFVRVEEPLPNKLFIAWFGPKGVASMLFALLVLGSQEEQRTLVFDVAAFTIITSIFAHGLTDTVGARWLEARLADRRGVPADQPS